MAADVLRDRMQHNVDAQVERALDEGRSKSVVDDRQNATRLAELGNLRQIRVFEERIGRRLPPDHFRVRLDCLLQRASHIRIGVAGSQAHGTLSYTLEQSPGTTVQIVCCNDMAA